MHVAVAAARRLVYHAAWLRDHGRPFKTEAATAKLYATEAAIDATRSATQVFGGYGFMDETAVVAPLPRRQDPRDRRGHERGPAAGDQPGARTLGASTGAGRAARNVTAPSRRSTTTSSEKAATAMMQPAISSDSSMPTPVR